jgi:hypothetical protein
VSHARNVNALEEVPDSTWFTNRVVTPARAAIGACDGVAQPALPLLVTERKGEGTTPGLFVQDALGRHWLMKVDVFADRPETSTAADAIGSRIYWTVGYNVPCNYVVWTPRDAIFVSPAAFSHDALGQHVPFLHSDLESILDGGVNDRVRGVRLSASLVLEGEVIGPWPGTGVRDDDPNDAVPHEARRELRGERWLAAWLNHWDAREVNTLDTFVRVSHENAGFVRHYFVDWSDALGGHTALRRQTQSLGWLSMVSVPIGPQPWRSIHIDPEAPNLGYFTASPFDPMEWQPILPLPRFAHADIDDFAWMARRLARVGPEHVASIAATGAFSNPRVTDHLIRILVARRATLLREAFARRSPLADVSIEDAQLCAVDLGVESGVSEPLAVSYAAVLNRGSGPHASSLPVPTPDPHHTARVCTALPAHATQEDYFTVDLIRDDAPHTTTLRIHVYDLGRERGFHVAGLERLAPR